MNIVLSYFEDYFSPDKPAKPELVRHSAAWLARNLYEVLSEFGTVTYIDTKDEPKGIKADLFVGHFWSFLRQATSNSFDKQVAFYSIANPDWTRTCLLPLAEEYRVPFPEWDFPPVGFNNTATLAAADEIMLVGNTAIAETFPGEARARLQTFNYRAADWFTSTNTLPKKQFCYVATQCDLRKGFMDVLRTWQALGAEFAPIDLIGSIREPWETLLQEYNPGNMCYRGWLDSSTAQYLQQLQNHRFAYIPTYSEGQMGTVLEAIFSGCIPVTTAQSGIDDRVLEHCVIVEPRAIEQHVQVIKALSQWSEQKWLQRRDKLLSVAQTYQTEQVFCNKLRQRIVAIRHGTTRRYAS